MKGVDFQANVVKGFEHLVNFEGHSAKPSAQYL